MNTDNALEILTELEEQFPYPADLLGAHHIRKDRETGRFALGMLIRTERPCVEIFLQIQVKL